MSDVAPIIILAVFAVLCVSSIVVLVVLMLTSATHHAPGTSVFKPRPRKSNGWKRGGDLEPDRN